jgi:TRAP-type mannitol/chloroaromatic compound transport system substrate-binding protein
MQSVNGGIAMRTASVVGAFVISAVFCLGTARADDKTYVMKITLPTLNDAPHVLAKNFAAAVERDSGGRIKGEIYPASQLGSIPRQIEGTQFGAIQVCINPAEFFVGVDERFEVWVDGGGELNSLPPDEQAKMIQMISPVADEVSQSKPALHDAYQVVAAAAKRLRQSPSQ